MHAFCICICTRDAADFGRNERRDQEQEQQPFEFGFTAQMEHKTGPNERVEDSANLVGKRAKQLLFTHLDDPTRETHRDSFAQ